MLYTLTLLRLAAWQQAQCCMADLLCGLTTPDTFCAALFLAFGTCVAGCLAWTLEPTFVLALHELYIMAPVAFVLEFFVVDGLAHKLAFTFMRPDDRPQFISYAISFCICCVMCPVMSLIATVLFKEQPSFAVWVQTWGMNLPCALLWQLCYCGPFVRLVFRTFFRQK